VIVAFVDQNPLVASVQPSRERDGVYVLSMELGFVDTLADDELEAVVAHELGHVWIYSNHPYLQTEQLANRIAMRRVTRESLERVYQKLWGAGALKGSLSNFLGLPPAARATPSGNRPRGATPASH
jgi:Peptidase family M48